jgi:hypothetical protein
MEQTREAATGTGTGAICELHHVLACNGRPWASVVDESRCSASTDMLYWGSDSSSVHVNTTTPGLAKRAKLST